jgi:hypothetical protein
VTGKRVMRMVMVLRMVMVWRIEMVCRMVMVLRMLVVMVLRTDREVVEGREHRSRGI